MTGTAERGFVFAMPPRPWRGVCVLLLVKLLFAVGVAQAEDPIDYTVKVVGVEDAVLRESVLRVSQLQDENRRPVTTMRALRRRVDESLPRIEALLRSRAYYAATQTAGVERTADDAAIVKIEIALGPAYRIARYDIRITTPGEPRYGLDIPFKSLELAPGDVAESAKIVEADTRLLGALSRRAYPLARIENRKTVVDHAAHTMSVEIALATGPYARFGATRTDGLESVDRDVVTRYIGWMRGTPYDGDALNALRSKLRQTGLFSSVLVRHSDKVDDRNEIDIVVGVKERKHRSIGVGAAYSTGEGALGKLFWEHRKLFGGGERLRIRGEVGEIRQGAFGDLRIPAVGSVDQDLVFDARVTNEQREGFDSLETGATGRIERRFTPVLSGSAGVGFDRSDVDENNARETFTFLTLPVSLRRDTSDDLLDPSKGSRATLSLTPNIGIVDTDLEFLSGVYADSIYFPLLADKKLIFAGWMRIGTIVGEETADIPANKRLYAGGAGSVRAYALDTIGPLDGQNDPVGGRSSTEFGVELRWRVYGAFGLAAFAEAGGVYDGSVPDWGKDLQWGAGLGGRYLTAVGPIRLDVAVPINRRNEIDDAFQILVSLGQAF